MTTESLQSLHNYFYTLCQSPCLLNQETAAVQISSKTLVIILACLAAYAGTTPGLVVSLLNARNRHGCTQCRIKKRKKYMKKKKLCF